MIETHEIMQSLPGFRTQESRTCYAINHDERVVTVSMAKTSGLPFFSDALFVQLVDTLKTKHGLDIETEDANTLLVVNRRKHAAPYCVIVEIGESRLLARLHRCADAVVVELELA